MATKYQRYKITVNPMLLGKIVKFQEDNGFATRSGAILELIRIGLAELEKEESGGD